jgi:FkbM family methyltransferase
MIKKIKCCVRELKRWRKLFNASLNAKSLRCQLQAIYYLSIHYSLGSAKYFDFLFRFLHDLVAAREGKLIRYCCSVGSENAVIMLRFGNSGDYRIAGEFTEGIYSEPDFIPEEIHDCGANIGAFSIFAAKKFPLSKLICFEPDRDNLKLLKKNLELNGIHAEINECGVWNKTGVLYYHPSSSITGQVSEEKSDFPILVQRLNVTTSKSWVKMDIEGSEYIVIPDMLARSPLPKFLSLELHYFNVKGRPIVDALEKNNYKLRGYIKDFLECVVFDASLDLK